MFAPITVRCVCPCVLCVLCARAGLHLVVGTDNSLQAFDPTTMLLKWYVEFETPPVAAYRADGRGGNALDPEQAGRSALNSGGTASGGGLVPAARAPVPAAGGGFFPSRKVKGQLAGGTSVLVGALHGSLYALPADHLMLAASPANGVDPDGSGSPGAAAAVVWPKKAGRMPLDITPAVVDMCAAAPAAAGGEAAAKPRLPGSGAASGAVAAAPSDGSGSSSGAIPNSSGEGGSALALLDESSEAGAGVVALNPADNGAGRGGD